MFISAVQRRTVPGGYRLLSSSPFASHFPGRIALRFSGFVILRNVLRVINVETQCRRTLSRVRIMFQPVIQKGACQMEKIKHYVLIIFTRDLLRRRSMKITAPSTLLVDLVEVNREASCSCGTPTWRACFQSCVDRVRRIASFSPEPDRHFGEP